MKIFNPHNNPYNFDRKLQPLFDALVSGKTIRHIRCMAGSSKAENPELDFMLTDTIGECYYVGACVRFEPETKRFDLVDIIPQGERDSFYMNWVREFEL